MRNRLQAIKEIMGDVAPDWKCPLAVNLAAPMGADTLTADQGTANEDVFFEYFRSDFFKGKLVTILSSSYDTIIDNEWLLN